ncbi:MAG: response regulator [bacterium]|nr:response regulator [bacterium]
METHPKYKVYLIDDDAFLLNMYSLKFSNNGFEVQTSQHPTEVLSKLKEGFVPDILLLDIIMPGMDGLDLLEHIRKENYAPNATVVMLTNQSDTTDIDRAKSLGVDGYIVKATTIPSEVISDVLEIHKKHLNI